MVKQLKHEKEKKNENVDRAWVYIESVYTVLEIKI